MTRRSRPGIGSMRWPLKNQILLPMVGVMLAALAGVSALNAYLSARRARIRIEQELNQVADTLADSTFPLTDNVMRQMRGLAGAEFVLTDRQGKLLAASSQQSMFADLSATVRTSHDDTTSLTRQVVLEGRRFLHTAIVLRRPSGEFRPRTLHVFYPEESYLQATRDAIYSPLIVGGMAVIFVVGLSLGIASRLTQPLRRLQVQVNEIAQGQFRSLPISQRNDEIADLSQSVNQMAEMLATYEAEVRRNEQMRTLGQLSGGMAHQMRNAATGCRMAVELHMRECSAQSENLEVAKRQLELMERHLQRFLSLGRAKNTPHAPVELQQVIQSVVALVAPMAKHVGVELEAKIPDQPLVIQGDSDALEQLMINLTLNGIEAASQQAPLGPADYPTETSPDSPVDSARSDAPRSGQPTMTISLQTSGEFAKLEFCDSGNGPAADVAQSLFEPFVTDKADGTGLGLAVAQEIALAHGGKLGWCRREAQTCFVVELPRSLPNDHARVGG